MAFNGSGTFNRLYSWVADAAAAIKISSTRMDAEMDGMATGLSTCLTKDGQTTPTANLPMGTYVHTGVGDSTSLTSYPSTKQVQNGALTYDATDAGAANAYVAALPVTITAYTAGLDVFLKIANTNTGASTLNVDGLGVKNIKTHAGTDPGAGAILAGQIAHFKYDGTNFLLMTEANLVHTTGNETVAGNKTLTGTLSMTAKAINEAKGAAIASVAGTTDIWTPADGNTVHITGTNAITSFGTAPQAGAVRHIIADAAFSLVDGANLVCPGGNITCAADDSFDVRADTTTKMYVEGYTRADGTSLVGLTLVTQEITASGNFTMPAAQVFVGLIGGGGGGGATNTAGVAASGGDSAALAIASIPPLAAGTILTVTLGAAGTGRAAGTVGNGTIGGTSTIVDPNGETIASAPGGAGGIGDGTQANNVAGTATSGYIPAGYPGRPGEAGEADGADQGGDGANSVYRTVLPSATYIGGLGSTVNNGYGLAPAAGVYGAGGGGSTGNGGGGNGSVGAAYFWWWI